MTSQSMMYIKQFNPKDFYDLYKEKCGSDIDLSIHLESTAYGDFENYYEEKIYQIYSGYAESERRKWGVERLGLCLVLAWTNEIIQWGDDLELPNRH